MGKPSKTDTTPSYPLPISFNRLGPFYRLQRRLGLLSDTNLAAGRRALLFAALAWVPLVLLALVQGNALNEHHERSVLLDFSVYAIAFAIVAFVLMEPRSDQRMAWLVGQFTARGIVTEAARAQLALARQKMEKRTGLGWVEALLLVAAYGFAYMWMQRGVAGAGGGTWYGLMQDGAPRLMLAGWWALLVALPLFWFLLGRWLWRFITWGLLLRDIAGCDLRLVATHPDRCGGLSFIAKYPNTYLLFVFAISLVVSSSVLKHVVYGGASLMAFKIALFGMVAGLIIAFVLPLLVFTPVLLKLKQHGLSRYAVLASRHNLAFEEKWAMGESAESPLGSPDISSLADLAAGYQLVQDIRPLPLTLSSIVPLILAALLPIAVVAATQAPFKQVLAAIKSLLPM